MAPTSGHRARPGQVQSRLHTQTRPRLEKRAHIQQTNERAPRCDLYVLVEM